MLGQRSQNRLHTAGCVTDGQHTDHEGGKSSGFFQSIRKGSTLGKGLTDSRQQGNFPRVRGALHQEGGPFFNLNARLNHHRVVQTEGG